VHTIPDPLATSIAAAYVTTSTRSSATSAPAPPGCPGDPGDPGAPSLLAFFSRAGMTASPFFVNRQECGCPGGEARENRI